MKLSITYVCFLFVSSIFLPLDSSELADRYINKYKGIAISEMQRTGIPASIKLAQGLLESDWGRSNLATQANNHFGIKCSRGWNGGQFYKHDDDRNANGELVESCFRKYSNAESSYIAHSEFLVNGTRYNSLFELDHTDYKNWAKGLRRAGYATDRKYPAKLIAIIEKYDLHRFDTMAQESENYYADKPELQPLRPANTIITPDEELSITDSNFESTQTSTERTTRKTEKRKPKTKRKFDKDRMYHHVKEGDTMESIARAYRIDLSMLYAKNRMPKGAQPLIGELIKLKGISRTDRRPKFIRFPQETHQDSIFIF